METITRFLKPPRQSFFLLGPRGTGKTLWTESSFKDALKIDFLEPDTFRLYSSNPERLKEKLAGSPSTKTVIVDEVQKVPEILSVIHGLMERNRSLQFVLTGSSARKLKRSGVDLLAGRALNKTLHPFMAAEIGKSFDLSTSLRRGLLPVVWGATNPDETLKAYHGLYLREEIQMEALTRNVGNFGRFLETISFSHASVLNLANISRECAVERKTVEGYLQILKDTLLAFELPVFSKKAKRETASHPKFYLFDTGVFRSLRPLGPLDQPEEIEGASLEGLVAQHLVAWNAYRGGSNQISHWRTRSQVEVDFVVYGEDGLWAFEVKNTKKIRPEDARGLRSFGEDYPRAQLVLLYRGSETLKKDRILRLPCESFFSRLHPERNFQAVISA